MVNILFTRKNIISSWNTISIKNASHKPTHLTQPFELCQDSRWIATSQHYLLFLSLSAKKYATFISLKLLYDYVHVYTMSCSDSDFITSFSGGQHIIQYGFMSIEVVHLTYILFQLVDFVVWRILISACLIRWWHLTPARGDGRIWSALPWAGSFVTWCGLSLSQSSSVFGAYTGHCGSPC